LIQTTDPDIFAGNEDTLEPEEVLEQAGSRERAAVAEQAADAIAERAANAEKAAAAVVETSVSGPDKAAGPAAEAGADKAPETGKDGGATKPAPPTFAQGDIIGGSYELVDLLGRGGMGMVFRAKHVSMPALYALKILITEDVTENKFLRFQNEAQAIAKLNHPNIISIYNFGLHDGRLPFYVMDLLDGENLHDIIKRDGPAPMHMALPIFIEVASGLSHAHRKGILHRDVKPANIVMLKAADVRGARIKIVDFGIVKFAEELKPEIQKLTAIGAVCGSPSFMSPEQACGEKVDARSDVYSLGCSLFQTLTGKVPFHGRNATETMLMHHEVAAPTLESKGDGRKYSEDLEVLMSRMLAKEPMDRYQNMELVAQDLRNVLEGKPLGTPSPTIPRPGSRTGSFESGMLPNMAPTMPTKNSRSTNYNLDSYERLPSTPLGKSRDTRNRIDATQLPSSPAYSRSVFAAGETSSEDSSERSGISFTTLEVQQQKRIKTTKHAMLGVLTACLFGACVLISIQAFQPHKQVIKTVLDESTSLKTAVMRDPSDLQATGKVELTKDKYFSKTITVGGREYIKFDFPTPSSGDALAWIAPTPPESRRAEGEVTFLKGPPLFLAPNRGALDVPQFFEKFRPGDVKGIALFPMAASDQLFIEATSIPGVEYVIVPKCPQLTDKIMPALSPLKLIWLNCAESSIDGQVLATAQFWQNLRYLNLSKCKNITPVLRKLTGSKNLEVLDVEGTNLKPADYKLLSDLPHLKSLVLDGNQLSDEDLRSISKLHNLKTLSLLNVKMDGAALTKAIKQFNKLKDLGLVTGDLKPFDEWQLRKQCPNLRIKIFSQAEMEAVKKAKTQQEW
jgi:serine/threonine-protein kinase